MAARDRSPLDWYYLIAEVEAFTERTGWGMAQTWGCINQGQYREALLILSECLATEAEGNAGPASPEANRARLRRQIADQEQWRADNLGPLADLARARAVIRALDDYAAEQARKGSNGVAGRRGVLAARPSG